MSESSEGTLGGLGSRVKISPRGLSLCQPTTNQKPPERSHLKMEVLIKNWRTSRHELSRLNFRRRAISVLTVQIFVKILLPVNYEICINRYRKNKRAYSEIKK